MCLFIFNISFEFSWVIGRILYMYLNARTMNKRWSLVSIYIHLGKIVKINYWYALNRISRLDILKSFEEVSKERHLWIRASWPEEGVILHFEVSSTKIFTLRGFFRHPPANLAQCQSGYRTTFNWVPRKMLNNSCQGKVLSCLKLEFYERGVFYLVCMKRAQVKRLSRGPSRFGEFGNDQRQGIPITVTAKPPAPKPRFRTGYVHVASAVRVCLSIVTVSAFVYKCIYINL